MFCGSESFPSVLGVFKQALSSCRGPGSCTFFADRLETLRVETGSVSFSDLLPCCSASWAFCAILHPQNWLWQRQLLHILKPPVTQTYKLSNDDAVITISCSDCFVSQNGKSDVRNLNSLPFFKTLSVKFSEAFHAGSGVVWYSFDTFRN